MNMRYGITLTDEQKQQVQEQGRLPHHPACPKTLRHRVRRTKSVVLKGIVTYEAICTICGDLPLLTIYDDANRAIRGAVGHEHDEPCPGGKCIALIGALQLETGE